MECWARNLLSSTALAALVTGCGGSSTATPPQDAVVQRTTPASCLASAPLAPVRASRLDVSAVTGLASSLDGARYAVGQFGTATDPDFGNGHVLHAQGNTDVFLTRLDAGTGLATWASAFGDDQTQSATGVAVAGNGEVGIIGRYKGSIRFGSTTLGPTEVAHDFIAGVDGRTGAGRWARSVALGTGGKLTAVTGRVSLLGLRTIVVCGTTSIAATDLMRGALAGGGSDLVVAALDAPTGNVRWARQLGGVGDQTCDAVAMDLLGDVYLTGQYAGALDLDGRAGALPVPAADAVSTYVAKLSALDGRTLAAAAFGQANLTATSAIAVEDGAVFLAGLFSAPTRFGTVTLTPVGELDAFAIRLDAATLGQVAWARRFGGVGGAEVRGMGVDPAGELVVAGPFAGTIDFGADAQTLTSAGLSDVYLARLDGASGAVTFATRYGDANSQTVTALDVTRLGPQRGAIALAGGFAGAIDFGAPTSPLTTLGPSDVRAFLAELKERR